MAALSNTRHELFAEGVARGLNATNAYVAAGYGKKGARQNATRLMTRDGKIRARIEELRTTITAGVIALEISNRNARVQALQDAFDRLRRIIEARANDETMAAVPGGSTGLLVCDCKGKTADVPVYRVDIALLAELRAILRQAAEELGQWVEKPQEAFSVDIVARLNEGRRRVAEARKQELAKLNVTPIEKLAQQFA
jgi:hypothetical protein